MITKLDKEVVEPKLNMNSRIIVNGACCTDTDKIQLMVGRIMRRMDSIDSDLMNLRIEINLQCHCSLWRRLIGIITNG